MTGNATLNTDWVLWREVEGDHFASSLHVTAQGGIGINVGGTVIVKPLREWHRLAMELTSAEEGLRVCARCGTPEGEQHRYRHIPEYVPVAASGIEARSDATPKSGAAEGESPVGDSRDAQSSEHSRS